MGDVFTFASPQRTAPAAKYTSPSRTALRVTKKRRLQNAPMFTQRACVAQVDDPLFCPSNASLIFTSAAILHPAPSTNDINEYIDFYDDDDDEPGGVSLPPNDHDHDMTDIDHDVHMTDTPVQNSYDSRNFNFLDTHQPSPPATSAEVPDPHTGRNVHRPYHPRPETREILEEESRRVRLALDGETSQEMAEFDLPAALSDGLFESHLSRVTRANSAVFTRTRAPTPYSQRPSRSNSNHDLLTASHLFSAGHTTDQTNDNASGVPDLFDIQDMPLDEDALAVDDPRRNYDFAEFMDSWRLRSLCDKRLPRYEPGIQPSVRRGRTAKSISRRQVQAGSVDMQGLHWSLLGPSRESASKAREILHPSSNSYLPSKSKTTLRAGASDAEMHYRFRSFMPEHKAKINHYQLRNVLAANNRNEIYYAIGDEVDQASLACPDVCDTAMNLSRPSTSATGFRVTCLASSSKSSTDPVLFAGGFAGQWALRGRGKTTEGYVTHAYNGLVTHVHCFADRRSGLLQAAFCSNDRQVRLMDVSTLQFTNNFSYDNAINCSATSADGRLRVLVGDSSEVLITNADRGNALVTLRDHNDHGFACDWSADGRYVATAAQDGKTLVWDARNWSEPLQTLHSVMSCARSLNFTDKGALVVAENEDVVRVYDGGSFDACQELRFFGPIAGVALLDGGAEMVVANSDRTVGGLLSFERASQGLGNGSYGRRIADRGRRHAESSSLVQEVVV